MPILSIAEFRMLTPSQIRVLQTLQRINHPAGYWAIVARLELRKRLLKEHLVAVLDALVACGLVAYAPAPGYQFGSYWLTEAGEAWLAQELGAEKTV